MCPTVTQEAKQEPYWAHFCLTWKPEFLNWQITKPFCRCAASCLAIQAQTKPVQQAARGASSVMGCRPRRFGWWLMALTSAFGQEVRSIATSASKWIQTFRTSVCTCGLARLARFLGPRTWQLTLDLPLFMPIRDIRRRSDISSITGPSWQA